MIEVTGAQLHAARVLAGLSRQELADRAYVSRDNCPFRLSAIG